MKQTNNLVAFILLGSLSLFSCKKDSVSNTNGAGVSGTLKSITFIGNPYDTSYTIGGGSGSSSFSMFNDLVSFQYDGKSRLASIRLDGQSKFKSDSFPQKISTSILLHYDAANTVPNGYTNTYSSTQGSSSSNYTEEHLTNYNADKLLVLDSIASVSPMTNYGGLTYTKTIWTPTVVTSITYIREPNATTYTLFYYDSLLIDNNQNITKESRGNYSSGSGGSYVTSSVAYTFSTNLNPYYQGLSFGNSSVLNSKYLPLTSTYNNGTLYSYQINYTYTKDDLGRVQTANEYINGILLHKITYQYN